MRPDNPACLECSKGRGELHSWKITDEGATCTNCGLKLNQADAADLFFGASAYEQESDNGGMT